jgi:NAD(P)-dependent dehydrogenase (short-subunit alcohol dehydrogenase family)
VGCGCRGLELARALAAEGHAVRGTTRDPTRHDEIAAAGAEAALADPDRLGTLLPRIEGITAMCWLMGTAAGEPEALAALHGPRLRSLLEHLVDTPVRGFVYEGAGSLEPDLLENGAAIALGAGETYRMRVEVVDRDPGDLGGWLEAMRDAVGRVLGEARLA